MKAIVPTCELGTIQWEIMFTLDTDRGERCLTLPSHQTTEAMQTFREGACAWRKQRHCGGPTRTVLYTGLILRLTEPAEVSQNILYSLNEEGIVVLRRINSAGIAPISGLEIKQPDLLYYLCPLLLREFRAEQLMCITLMGEDTALLKFEDPRPIRYPDLYLSNLAPRMRGWINQWRRSHTVAE